MSDVVIEAQRLGKRYRLGERQGFGDYRGLHARLEALVRAPLRRLRPPPAVEVRPRTQTRWALRDVSFQVRQGEVVALAGPNGAGKSVLLKLLCRITRPTEGYARIRGRVGSMLEVGAGFHPELTGRENVYLAGALLGMQRARISRHFDEIVEFAGVGLHLDTPVKRYSSGMYLRLAFAIAANLEAEILLVDEVIAVADEEFRAKCLDTLQRLAAQGRTILFVSHDPQAVTRLCSRALLLDQGRLLLDSTPADVLRQYRSRTSLRARRG